MLYAYTENFILPYSHDEVVHGKRSMLDKMPGDAWQKAANLRALYAFMYAHPGKKLLFMGDEFGQWREWNSEGSLDWDLLEQPPHQGLAPLVRELNRLYAERAGALRARFRSAGLPVDRLPAITKTASSSFLRRGADARCARGVRVQLDAGRARGTTASACRWPATWQVLLNTDDRGYGGSGAGTSGVVEDRADPRARVHRSRSRSRCRRSARCGPSPAR